MNSRVLKNKAAKRPTINLGGILFLVGAVYAICYVLICGNVKPISIETMSVHFNHVAKHWRILAVGLLPVYIALMVFGTAVVGVYLGSAFHRWIVQLFQK